MPLVLLSKIVSLKRIKFIFQDLITFKMLQLFSCLGYVSVDASNKELCLLVNMIFAALKMVQIERSFAEKHYEDLSGKSFFPGLVEYVTSGPVVAMVWAGKGVVLTGRKIIGATNPAQAEPGTIRGDFAIDVGR